LDADGSNYRELTGGDTVELAPAWIPDEPNKILYQSCGIARNRDGYVIAQKPASIQLLDLNNGELTTIRKDTRNELLQPKVSPVGDLYFIRRPY